MKVGVVTEWFARGAAYVSAAYIEALQSVGAEVSVFARHEHQRYGEDLWPQQNLWQGKSASLLGPKAFRHSDFKRWLKETKPDVLLFNEQNWWPPVEYAKAVGIPCVAYVDYYTKETIRRFALYDMLLVNTKRHLSAFSWHPNCVFIPWGTDTRRFVPSSENRTSPTAGLTFLHSAGWSPYRKGTDLVLRSFLNLKDSSSSLLIATQAPKTEIMRLLDAPEQDLVLQHPQISIVQSSDIGPEFYNRGHVYVYPSRLEGIGLTQAEALSSGLPLVVTDEAPMNEFAEAPHCGVASVERRWMRDDGYYWPMAESNIASLTTLLREFEVAFDSGDEWSTACRRYAVEHLDWQNNSQPIFAALSEQVINGPSMNQPLSASTRAQLALSNLPTAWHNAVRRTIDLRSRLRHT